MLIRQPTSVGSGRVNAINMDLLELCNRNCMENVACVWEDLHCSGPIHWTYTHLYTLSHSLACKLRKLLYGCVVYNSHRQVRVTSGNII